MQLEDATQQHYWDRLYAKDFVYTTDASECWRLAQPRVQQLQQQSATPIKVLMLAEGYGRNAFACVEQCNVATIAFDISAVALQKGANFYYPRLRVLEKEQKLTFVQGDILHLDEIFAAESFDVVFSNFCFNLFAAEQRNIIYQKAEAVLKNNGYFINSFSSVSDIDFETGEIAGEDSRIVRGKKQYFFTQAAMQRELENQFVLDEITEHAEIERIIPSVVKDTHFYFVVAKKII